MTSRPHYRLYILMILAMTVWGLAWPSGKILGSYASAPVLMFWRYLISALTFIPIMIFYHPSAPKLTRNNILYVIAGAVLITLYNLFFFLGTKIGLAGTGGVLVTTMNPIVTYLLILLLYKSKPYRKDIIGLILGFIGGGIILRIWALDYHVLLNSGNLYFILCALSWAVLTLVTSRAKEHIQTLTFTFWVFSISAILIFPFAAKHLLMEVFTYDWKFWLNMGVISVGSMAFGTTVYFIGTTRLGSEKASAFIFTVPVSAMGFSMLFLGERLELETAIGSVLAMVAVYLINKKHPIDTTLE